MNSKQIGVSKSMEEASVVRRPKQQQRKKRKKNPRVKTHIPIEIVKEILDRLPLKSLARFKCVSKDWHSLAKTISRQRFDEEWRRAMPKFFEARRRADDLRGGGPDERLRAGRARLRASLEEVQSVLDLLDGIDRYVPDRGDSYHRLGAYVVAWARGARGVLASADAICDADDFD